MGISKLKGASTASDDMVLIDGGSNSPLVAAVAVELGIAPHPAAVQKFNDGETSVQIKENVRGKNVFVVQSTSEPVNEHLMDVFWVKDPFA